MMAGYVKEICNASLKQFAISLEDEKGGFDIMLVVNMEKEPIDHITMRYCLEYISMKYLGCLLSGFTAASVQVPARRSLSNTWLDTYVKNFQKKKTQSVQKNLQL